MGQGQEMYSLALGLGRHKCNANRPFVGTVLPLRSIAEFLPFFRDSSWDLFGREIDFAYGLVLLDSAHTMPGVRGGPGDHTPCAAQWSAFQNTL